MHDAFPTVPTVYTPPERRNLVWFVRHFWRNFLGTVPMVVILVLGVIFTLPVSWMAKDGWGYRWAWGWFLAWCRSMLRGFGVRVWARGLEHVEPNRMYIICPNHRSHFDVLALGVTLPLRMVSVHKKSLEYIPFVGQALWVSRSVGLNRNDKTDARRRLQLVAHRLRTGRSVVIFPEGRRATGPGLDVFRKGAAVVACEQGAPILPITVVGTDAIYPPNHIMVHRGDALLVIHPPIETKGMSLDDRDELMRKVRGVIEQDFEAGPLRPERLAGARRIL